jgi:hypothetical protein
MGIALDSHIVLRVLESTPRQCQSRDAMCLNTAATGTLDESEKLPFSDKFWHLNLEVDF